MKKLTFCIIFVLLATNLQVGFVQAKTPGQDILHGIGSGLTIVPSLLPWADSASSIHSKQAAAEKYRFTGFVGDDLGEDLAPEIEAAPAMTNVLGTFQVAGQILTVTEIDLISPDTSRITSCGQGVLYSTRTDGTLWVNLNGGNGPWHLVTAGTQGTKIACDRRHLYALSANGDLYHANTRSDGQLNTIDPNDPSVTQIWSNTVNGRSLAVPAGTDEIEGGMGNIYALKFNSSSHVGTLYSSQLLNPTSPSGYVQGASDSWVQLANNLGTNLGTGAGSKATFNGWTSPGGLGTKYFNRAFGASPDDTLYYNDGLLYGVNNWTSFPNAGQVILSIAADASNTMYALVKNRNERLLIKHLVRFSFAEGVCNDGLDNDANGQIDAEDPNCRARLATAWCQSHTGSYCIDRIESGSYYYTHSLITCNSGGQPPTIQAGLCSKGTLGHDFLPPARANNEPLGSGHYCNMIMPDGSWDFEKSGATPCATLRSRHPRGTIVRAGIYSTTGINNVHVRCDNGNVTEPEDVGTAPLIHAYNAVGHTQNRCVFTVSPKAMRVFNAPFPVSAWDRDYGWRGYSVGHVFDHVPQCVVGDPGCPCPDKNCPVSLAPFGNGEINSTNWLDNNGRAVTTYQENQNAYDYIINEGTPLRSLGYGTVVTSRDRDLASFHLGGTTYQGEIYIRYDVGSDPVYAETFVAYYAHIGKRVVVTGQTVAPGQLIGYSGTTGASSDPHLHFGLFRLSNTNGRTVAGQNSFGYHIPFRALLTNGYGFNAEAAPGAIDPYGWRAGDLDPMGYRWSYADSGVGVIGIGAWSPQMWISGEVPPYPVQ